MIARTVTVEAGPEQVAGLALAQQSGRLTLSLVGAGDTTDIGAIEVIRTDRRDRRLGALRAGRRRGGVETRRWRGGGSAPLEPA